MLLALLSIAAGFAALIWSADRFVEGAAATARQLGMSPLLIGLTVVALGTSAPEILVSVMAALDDHTGLAAGNAIGSNIANIGLVLAITALIAPLPVKNSLILREIPLLVVVTLLAGACLFDLHLGVSDGLLLLSAMLVTLYLLFRWQKPPLANADQQLAQAEADEIPEMPLPRALGILLIGLVVLIISSRALVWGATEMALMFGVSDLVIGLTVVAVGTSLPELAASIASALKKHHEIALGNVVGSNLFNLLTVLAVPGLISPSSFGPEILMRDYLSMLGFTLLLAAMAWLALRRGGIGRLSGSILFACYSAYYVALYFTI
ncbi:calcium/sodium antiporter [Aestuariirhabdus litorea]|uniref:Calcium/sodium antiporter n=1 Tax=Aestuariirhabdus litorea TaxID=2528527 RepID=A0A3P3VLV7_9GAMM|nr:calcium/sodium antiporter [Aestuariirhabdus litorea]RRJ83725.1 calcium/sodium antiporter [Aestuariirhabdus litorea]RWW96948.1 calcium/sodium antiporter [Endozoicomonadaceae bacterium GTF-13]